MASQFLNVTVNRLVLVLHSAKCLVSAKNRTLLGIPVWKPLANPYFIEFGMTVALNGCNVAWL